MPTTKLKKIFDYASLKEIIFIAVLSFFFAFLINEVNLSYIKSTNPSNISINMGSTMYGHTVWSIDNNWYLPQIKNLLNGDGFTLDTHNPELKVRRTPVYPLFYGAHYVLFGEAHSFLLIKYSQLLLFVLSVILLGQSVFNLSGNVIWAKTISILYGINPYTVGFLYTTITEGISPAFVIISFFFYSLWFRYNKANYSLWLGISLGISILIRPALIVLLPSLFLAYVIAFLLGKTIMISRKDSLLICSGILLIMFPWTLRNFIVTKGEIVPLEKFYYGDPMDYGRGHISFRYWISSWDNPAITNPETYSNSIRSAIENNEDINNVSQNFVDSIPQNVYSINNRQEVLDALNELNACFNEKYDIEKINTGLTLKQKYETFNCEQVVSSKFDKLTEEHKSKTLFQYYVVSNLQIVKSVVFQSSSYMYAMLNPTNKSFNIFQTIIKSGMYIMNVALYLSVFLILFFTKKENSFLIAYPFFAAIGTFFLCCIFLRTMEARYMIPLYPFLYISLSFFISYFYIFVVKKLNFYDNDSLQ